MDSHRCMLSYQPHTWIIWVTVRHTEPTGPVAMINSCQDEGCYLITLAIASFPETGRVCRGKRHNKERMNGRMKERKAWSLNGVDWQSEEEGAGTRPWKLLFDNTLIDDTLTQGGGKAVYGLLQPQQLKRKVSNCMGVLWKGKGSAVKHLTDGLTSEQRKQSEQLLEI